MSTLSSPSPLTITLSLSPEEQKELRTRAAATGQQVDAYVCKLVKKEIEQSQTIDEILAPVHEEFRQSGMTDEELRDFIREMRDEVRQEKRAARKP